MQYIVCDEEFRIAIQISEKRGRYHDISYGIRQALNLRERYRKKPFGQSPNSNNTSDTYNEKYIVMREGRGYRIPVSLYLVEDSSLFRRFFGGTSLDVPIFMDAAIKFKFKSGIRIDFGQLYCKERRYGPY